MCNLPNQIGSGQINSTSLQQEQPAPGQPLRSIPFLASERARQAYFLETSLTAACVIQQVPIIKELLSRAIAAQVVFVKPAPRVAKAHSAPAIVPRPDRQVAIPRR